MCVEVRKDMAREETLIPIIHMITSLCVIDSQRLRIDMT